MNHHVKKAATAYIAPKLIARGFRMHWLAMGALAYFGLRFMNKRGIFPEQTKSALDLIDRGIDMAKEQIGWTSTRSNTSTAQNLQH